MTHRGIARIFKRGFLTDACQAHVKNFATTPNFGPHPLMIAISIKFANDFSTEMQGKMAEEGDLI